MSVLLKNAHHISRASSHDLYERLSRLHAATVSSVDEGAEGDGGRGEQDGWGSGASGE